eukprot:4511751-Prymnesium_polylepis.1
MAGRGSRRSTRWRAGAGSAPACARTPAPTQQPLLLLQRVIDHLTAARRRAQHDLQTGWHAHDRAARTHAHS